MARLAQSPKPPDDVANSFGHEYRQCQIIRPLCDGAGNALAVELRQFFESAFGQNLSRVRIHCDERSDQLNREYGSVAFASGEAVFFRRGAYAPGTPWGLWLLAHELAHVIQQRGSYEESGRGDPQSAVSLEDEANSAAFAVLLGRRAEVRPRPGCPTVQPAVPLLLLLAVAVGVALWPKDLAPEPKPDGSPALPHPSLHETGWGFVPVVGPLDQMINGKNLFSQMMGGVFFVLDVSLVGGLAVRGVKGVLFLMSPARKALLAAAAKAGPTAIERLSYEQLMKQGAKALTEKEAATMLKGLGQAGATTLVVGAQSGKQGVFHSIIYVIQDGKIYRLHGGIFRQAAGGQAIAVEKALAQGWNKGFNSFTVYSAKDLAARGITDEALSRLVKNWAGRSPDFISAVGNVCRARGCANSQWLLMQQLGLQSADGVGRYLPLLMETSRMSGSLGSHYIVNTTGAYAGTALQTLLVGGLAGSVRLADPLITAGPNVLENYLSAQQLSAADINRLNAPAGLAEQMDSLVQQENSVLMLPTDDLSLDGDASAFPNNGQIIVEYPNDPVVEQCTSINASYRLPQMCGAKRNALPPGQ